METTLCIWSSGLILLLCEWILSHNLNFVPCVQCQLSYLHSHHMLVQTLKLILPLMGISNLKQFGLSTTQGWHNLNYTNACILFSTDLFSYTSDLTASRECLKNWITNQSSLLPPCFPRIPNQYTETPFKLMKYSFQSSYSYPNRAVA